MSEQACVSLCVSQYVCQSVYSVPKCVPVSVSEEACVPLCVSKCVCQSV